MSKSNMSDLAPKAGAPKTTVAKKRNRGAGQRTRRRSATEELRPETKYPHKTTVYLSDEQRERLNSLRWRSNGKKVEFLRAAFDIATDEQLAEALGLEIRSEDRV